MVLKNKIYHRLTNFPKHLHLGLSAAIVFAAAFIYGGDPNTILPFFFDFEVENRELKNIFRAIMGLYIGFSIYWVVGILKKEYWKGATLSNIIFMGGLGSGRLISLFFDGISPQYTLGMVLEFIMMFWGIHNLKKIGK